MAAEQFVYSEIPVRTWRWLGVNEARVPALVASAEPQKRCLKVSAGDKSETVIVYRDEVAAALKIELEEGAEFHLVRVQLAARDMAHADTVEVEVAAGATFRYTAIEAGGAVAASKLVVNLNGARSMADVMALYFADGERRVDMNYLIRQRGAETDATMLVHGALTGRGEKVFRGTLDFVRGSAGSVGREREEVMLLSPKVRNRSVPLMLSGEADVDGHHAVTIGKIDENKLFYLMSRGLDREAAKKLIVDAAIAPVLARVPDEALAQEVWARIEEGLAHD